MLDGFRDKAPTVVTERAILMTESFKETEGLPIVMKWAKALENVARNIPIYIDEDELIVGRCGPPGKYVILYPELNNAWMDGGESDVMKDLKSYWKGRTLHEVYINLLPEDTRNFLARNDQATGIIGPSGTGRSSLSWNLDYEKILKRGFNGIKKEAEERLASLDPFDSENNFDKLPFYKAVIIVCDAINILASRYVKLARSLAAEETKEKRKKELLEIADILEWVPGNPARSFREAIQSQWFAQYFSRFEQNTGGVIGNGRIDQYLYPYYKKDIKGGRITDNEVVELLECLWLNMAQSVMTASNLDARGSGVSLAGRGSGSPHFEHTTIGGQSPDGRDATNELSYLILQSKKEFPLNHPDLSVRIHAQTPDQFLHKVCELIKEGTGFPKLLNDEEIIPLFLLKGATWEEARDYCGTGCTEVKMLNRDTYFTGGAAFNLGAVLEMALNDGKLQIFGNEPIGVRTGDPRHFKTFEDVWHAFCLQAENAMKHIFITQNVLDSVKLSCLAAPQISSLHDLCMENGKDIHAGKIKGGTSLGNFSIMGFGTAIDSLAAVKKLVFDDKKITMDELLEALAKNFSKKEALRQMCLNAPKYGNNDTYADSIGLEIEKLIAAAAGRYTTAYGGKLDYIYVPITAHVFGGMRVGATPNGRKALEALSEGISPTQGCDTKGPTTTLLSIANTKAAQYKDRAARLLNIKLSPQTVAGEEGTKRLASFIRSWCDMKFWHVQFNILNSETLREAQKDPEKYRNLLVRVAGYSAYFVDLSPSLQNEIIARTEHRSVQ
jgi:formate C-acetyltransferase